MIIKTNAYAKLNLTLDITGVLPDGYHSVDMIMQSISLCDIVTLTTNDCGAIVSTSDDEKLNSLGSNIVSKAATMFFETAGISDGVEIYIEKKIPLAAGLGGGSADAAAVLCALNNAYGNPLSNHDLQKIGLTLGADVPFCMIGGTVRALGKGENLMRLQIIPDCWIVIAKPCEKTSTGQIYSAVDNIKILRHPDTAAAIHAIECEDLTTLCDNIYNVFEAVWEEPKMDNVKLAMLQRGAIATGISGSGPTIFGIFDGRIVAQKCCDFIKSNQVWAEIASPVNSGNQILEIAD